MAVAVPHKTLEILSRIFDPEAWKAEIFRMFGNQKPKLAANQVLCAVYIEHEKTAGGIIKPQEVVAEDIWQGKPCMVVDKGPAAFVDNEAVSHYGFNAEPGDWVTFKIGNCTQIEVNKVPCRIIEDRFIQANWPDPRMVTS